MYIRSMNQHDICRLADLSFRMIHRMDFPENGELDLFRHKLVRLLDELQEKYQNNALLFDLRCAIVGQPFYKLELYKLTRRIVQLARVQTDSRGCEYGSSFPTTTSRPLKTRLIADSTTVN